MKRLIVLEGEKPMSWNKIYAGVHWGNRTDEADRVHLLVRAAIDPEWPMFERPVEIEVRAYFANRRLQLDWANVPAKLYEDGLIGWLIKDDSPAHVVGGRVLSLVDRERPRVEIEIWEIV